MTYGRSWVPPPRGPQSGAGCIWIASAQWGQATVHRRSGMSVSSRETAFCFWLGKPTMSTSRTASASDIASFYDDFSTRLLRDYVRGNRRVQAAIERVLDSIPPRAHSLLDIGCGIGVSSHAVARANGHLQVVESTSARAISTIAKRLFDDAESLVSCLRHVNWFPTGSPFDVISLLDVYEHIPLDRRHRVSSRSVRSVSSLMESWSSHVPHHFIRSTCGGTNPGACKSWMKQSL